MKLKISHFLYATFFSLLVPLFAFADEISGSVTIDKILKAINKQIINPAIIAIFAVALCVFIFGVVRFIWAKQQGDTYESDGKRHMIWGLVGMFIMASAFGIIQFIANTLTLDFKINNDGTTTGPGGGGNGGGGSGGGGGGGGGNHVNQIQGLDGIWYPKYTTSAECLARPDTSGEWLYDRPTGVCDFDGTSATGGGGNNGGSGTGGGTNPVINTQSYEYKTGYKQGFYDGYYKENPETQIGGQYFGQNNDTSNGYSMGYAAGQVAVDPLDKDQCDMVGGNFIVQINSNLCLTPRPRP